MSRTSRAALISLFVLGCSTSSGGGGDPSDAAAGQPDGASPDACSGDPAFPIFLNRGGGTYTSGPDHSGDNTSSLVPASVQLGAYPFGPASWTSLVDCVRARVAPFNIEITDEDPVNAEHIEIVVTDNADGFDFPQGVTGVAPGTCAFNRRDLAFVFAEVIGDSPEEDLCWNTAWALGATSTLERVRECSDVMGVEVCGEKEFRDQNADCGEFSPTDCQCSDGTQQNSYQKLLSAYGPAGCN